MSLSKNGDLLNRETDVISRLLDEPRAILYIDRDDSYYGVDSKVALDAL